MRLSYIAVAVLLAAATAGCTSSAAPRPTAPAQPGIPAQALRVACPAGRTAAARRSAALPERSVPPRFTPAAVVLCTPAIVFVNHNGRNVPATRQVATAGLGRLMTALRLPSAPPDPGVACADQVVSVGWFVLVGGNGQVLRPRIPVTECGEPSPAVLASLDALRWRRMP